MLKTDLAVIVEGKYDKIKLSAVLDALLISTQGFGIFSDREQQIFLRRLAVTRGILIITDSDAAGFRIRNFIHNIVREGTVMDAYIPDINGKEHRKEKPSKEGKLGVEGIPAELILQAIQRAGVCTETEQTVPNEPIVTADLYECGLTGTDNASERRRILMHELGLPARLCGQSMLRTLNSFVTRDELYAVCEKLFFTEGNL